MATEKMIIELDAKVDDLIKGMKQASDKTESLTKETKKLAKSIDGTGDSAKDTGDKTKKAGKKAKDGLDDMSKGAEKAERGARDLQNQAKKTAGSLRKMGSAAKTAGGAAGRGLSSIGSVAAVGLGAMAGAATAAAAAAVEMAKEIEIAAERTGMSAEEVQAMSYATRTVGIDMEKMGDISKDVQDRLGDFVSTGGGAFQDFADIMGLTGEEALETAKKLQHMSGPDALQYMVNQIESAGASGAQMTFLLESMAGDASNLAPLLRDGGAAMEELKQKFAETQSPLTQEEIDKLKTMGDEFNNLKTSFSNTIGKFGAEYADEFNGMMVSTQKFLKAAGDEFASGAFSKRLNAFYEAFSSSWGQALGINSDQMGGWIDGLSETFQNFSRWLLETLLTIPQSFMIAMNKVGLAVVETLTGIHSKVSGTFADMLDAVGADETANALRSSADEVSTMMTSYYEGNIDRYQKEKDAIIDRYDTEMQKADELVKKHVEAEAAKMEASGGQAGNATDVSFTDTTDKVDTEAEKRLQKEQQAAEAKIEKEKAAEEAKLERERQAEEARIEMLREMFAVEEELLAEQHARRLELLDEALDKGLISEERYTEKKKDLNEDYIEELKNVKKEDEKDTDKTEDSKLDSLKKGAKGAMQLGQVLFEDNKAIQAGMIVAETATNVVTSVKNSGGVPWGLPSGAAAAAMGIAQLAALRSSSKGGGSISGGSTAAPAVQRPDFQPESEELDVSSSSSGGIFQTMRIELATETGEELAVGMARQINKANKEGRV